MPLQKQTYVPQNILAPHQTDKRSFKRLIKFIQGPPLVLTVKEAQDHYCEGHFGDFWRSQIKSSEARTVSSEGAAAINTCIILTNRGLMPELTIANDGKEVALSVQYKPDVVADIKIKQFGPSNLTNTSCTITKDGSTIHMSRITDAAQTLHPADSVILTCLRER